VSSLCPQAPGRATVEGPRCRIWRSQPPSRGVPGRTRLDIRRPRGRGLRASNETPSNRSVGKLLWTPKRPGERTQQATRQGTCTSRTSTSLAWSGGDPAVHLGPRRNARGDPRRGGNIEEAPYHTPRCLWAPCSSCGVIQFSRRRWSSRGKAAYAGEPNGPVWRQMFLDFLLVGDYTTSSSRFVSD
jgi:hypothetical protein